MSEKKSYMGFQSEIPATSRIVRREVENTARRGLNEEEVRLLKQYRGKDYFKANGQDREVAYTVPLKGALKVEA